MTSAAVGAGSVLSGRYRLVEPLASGGMATVWRAQDLLLDRPVAVKEVLLPAGPDEEARETLRRRTIQEAQAAARLRHPAVVTIYDVVEHQGLPWIVMELVNAPNLQQLVRARGPLPPARVAAIGLRILDAMVVADAAGVQHRDIKPANVLVAEDGRVVLTDFGIARHVGDPALTTSGLIIGSPDYLAPERARGHRTSGLAADLWSLGATMYDAVEGRRPFERAGALPTLAAVVLDDPAPAVRAGPLRPVLEGLLIKDPLRRWDAERTRLTLARVMRGRPIDAFVPRQSPEDGPVLAGTAKLPPAELPARPETGTGPEVPPGPNGTGALKQGADGSDRRERDDLAAGNGRSGVGIRPGAAVRPAAGAGAAAGAGPAAAGAAAGAGTAAGAGAATAAGLGAAARPDRSGAVPPGPDRTEALTSDGDRTDGSRETAPFVPGPDTPPDRDRRPLRDRRRALLVVAGLVLLALVAVLVPLTLSGRGPGPAPNAGSGNPEPSISAGDPAGGNPAGGGPGATNGATATSAPRTTAPATSAPKPTTKAPAPTARTGAQVAVPAGFTRYRDPRDGFSVIVPAGWRPSRNGTLVDFHDPGSTRFLRIDTSNHPLADPYQNWVDYELTFHGKPGYRLIGIRRVPDYRPEEGWTTADWEFVIGGTHVLDRNIRVSDTRAHALYWSTPDSQWRTAASRRIFDLAAVSFVPQS